MNADKQYYSFLGGLVSQKLDERVDMDKFGKWFKVADNMRFFSTGAMQNRTGFVKVANTKNNFPNDNIRLLSFVFNNREAFLLELGQGYMRVFKDGAPILDTNGSIKVWNTSITFPADEDLKYAQSGDIIFLTIPSKGIYEIKRKNTEGTDWEVTGFDATIYPLGDENTDKQKTLSINPDPNQDLVYRANFENEFQTYDDLDMFYDISYGVPSGSKYLSSLKILFGKNAVIEKLNALIDKTLKTTFKASNLDCIVDQAKADYITPIYLIIYRLGKKRYYNQAEINNLSAQFSNFCLRVSGKNGAGEISCPTAVCFDEKYKTTWPWLKDSYEITKDDWGTIANKSTDASRNAMYEETANILDTKINSDYVASGSTGDRPKVVIMQGGELNAKFVVCKSDAAYLKTKVEYRVPTGSNNDYKYPYKVAGETRLNVTSKNFNFFADKYVGDIFSIRKKIQAKSFSSKGDAANKTFDLGSAGPKWRFITNGNWTGSLTLQYWDDSSSEWIAFRTVSSTSKDQPVNDNSSGEISGLDVVKYRIISNRTDGSVTFDFNTSGNEVNVYIRVDEIISSSQAKCSVIKNNCIDAALTTLLWANLAFSKTAGWPESVGFYQNRLFFGKDYNLYGSKTNDFWDFYEPIEVNDDDPINMSLLSYKVNEIVNIVTLKSFFVFTAGGEFGIGSSGALTQKDKFLKQYSAHGSAKPLPIVAGNMIMFVDTSEHTVRAFQYSFETDTYEAQDISVLLDEIIKGEKIISTAYSSNEKECYFLTEKGEIFVLKFFPEQNILAWSKWKHAKYHIKNICIMPRGSEEDLYITVNTENGMQIERMTNNFYADSVNVYNNDSEVEEINVPFPEGSEVVVNDTINKYNAVVNENNKIKLARPAKTVYVGLAYKSHAALLAPVTMLQDGSATTYNLRKTFKVHFKYSDSYGFKVGVLGYEHLLPNYQDVNQTIDNETVLTTGKKSVLMPSRYDMQGSISFIQEQPYPMIIENVMLEIDYGNR